MTSAAVSAIVNLILSLAGASCYFLIGWLWSASTWRRSFDLGWLVVAFILARYASLRIESTQRKSRDYLSVCLPALPGFVFEFLADWGLHDFRLYDGFGALVQFAAFSCALLVFVAGLTAMLRFGIGVDAISTRDEALWRNVVWAVASATAMSSVMGTAFILLSGTSEPGLRASALQDWFYWASLVVYLLLTLKMMLPVILRRWRTAIDALSQPDMRF